MEKVSARKLIDYRRQKTERSKKSFATKLKTREAALDKLSDGGGNYWASCVSVIYNVFKSDDLNLFKQKIEYLHEKKQSSEISHVKARHQINIDIVSNFFDFDFKEIKPDRELNYLHKSDAVLNINNFSVYVNSKVIHVFSFSNDGKDEIGTVAFVAIKGGFDKVELGIFADILYRYVDIQFGKKYSINSKYCIVVDVFTGRKACYKDIEDGNIRSLLEETIEEIKRQ